MIVFHGATWYGAFPRQIPGLRLSVANYYRQPHVLPQEDIHGKFPRELAEDCADPGLFKQLASFNDRFPYAQQESMTPRVAS